MIHSLLSSLKLQPMAAEQPEDGSSAEDGDEALLCSQQVQTTVVLDRSRHPAWAAVVAQVLGPAARSESRPDSSHYVDVTVLLGSAWRAPSKPLDP